MKRGNYMIDLSGKWISTFIQNNKMYNEEVFFSQNDNKISADITLNFDGEMDKYRFEGTIRNDIINGTYECLGDKNMESGTISLKVIDENFLYGVTTYISTDPYNDDVIQSPYALFRNSVNFLGTFDLCQKCVNAKANCCSNPSVDSPMLLPKEAEEISASTGLKIEEFAKKIDFASMHKDNSLKSLYQMKRTESGTCPFYINSKCSIYDARPLDCRIFPYDIKLEKDGEYYLVYYVAQDCETRNVDFDKLKLVSYNTRLFLRLLLPYMREWADPYCSANLTKEDNYKIICKIEDLF